MTDAKRTAKLSLILSPYTTIVGMTIPSLIAHFRL